MGGVKAIKSAPNSKAALRIQRSRCAVSRTQANPPGRIACRPMANFRIGD
jgi:hypothetical protein